jgi:hypothetical protein
MDDSVERFGRVGAGPQQRRKFLVQLLYLVSELHGVTKEEVLALERVRPEAACRTCCFEGMIERPKFFKKSMPRKGVATAASRKLNSKFCPEKQTVKQAKSPRGNGLAVCPPSGADRWAVPYRCAATWTVKRRNRLKI